MEQETDSNIFAIYYTRRLIEMEEEELGWLRAKEKKNRIFENDKHVKQIKK